MSRIAIIDADLVGWCNQLEFFKRISLRQFAELNGEKSACHRYLAEFEKANPAAGYFFDLKF